MKSYALVAYFNNEIEDKILKTWEALDELEITTYGTENPGRRPHITFADYDSLLLEGYFRNFELFFSNSEPIPVIMSVIGSFIGSKTVFIMDPANERLRSVHLEYHNEFRNYPVAMDSKYIPNVWIPHCTIASRLNGKALLDTYEFCDKSLGIVTGFINEYALLELTHDQSGKVISDCIVKRIVLNCELGAV